MMFRAGLFGAACLALLVGANAQILANLPSQDIVPPGFALQKSVSFIDLGDPNSGNPFIIRNYSDPLIAPPAGLTQYTPDQIHVTLAEAGSVWVSWTTGSSSFYQNMQPMYYPNNTIYAPVTPDPASVASTVLWGTKTGVYTNVVSGYARAYIQTYLYDGPTYISGLIHHVHVTNIPYGTTIYYKCGDQTKELSAEFPLLLKNSIRPNILTYPMRLGVVADVGQTYNSSVTYQHLVNDNPDAVAFMGDLSYADDWTDRGGDTYDTPSNPPAMNVAYAGTSKTLSQTYQIRWETMSRLLQRSGNAVSIPYMFLPGNHEIERDEYLRPFQSFTNRFRSPYEQSYSQDPLYYSLNVGPVHMIMMNNYDSYLPNTTLNTVYNNQSQVLFGNSGGPSFPSGNYPQSAFGAAQLSWLLNDLARIDRAVTPWVVAAWHAPPYNSYSTHYKEVECLRQMVEPFMYNAGVDIVLHGHVHAYERQYQVINYQLDGCAPRWLTMGDGGNIEGLYRQFAATNCSCSNPAPGICPCATVVANGAPQYCTTLQNGLFAPLNGTQPSYSAYREPSYGHGIIDFLNSTHALWTWNRNQDASSSVATDSVYFVRNLNCPNQKPGTPVPSPPSPPSAPPPPVSSPPPSTPTPTATPAPDLDQIIHNTLNQVLYPIGTQG